MVRRKIPVEDNEERTVPMHSLTTPEKLPELLAGLPEECRTSGFLKIFKATRNALGGMLEPTIAIVPANDPDLLDRIMQGACKHGPGDYFLKPLDTEKKPIPNPPQLGFFRITQEQIDEYKKEHPDKAYEVPPTHQEQDLSEDEEIRAMQREANNLLKRVEAMRRLKHARESMQHFERQDDKEKEIKDLENKINNITTELQLTKAESDQKTKAHVESALVQVLQSQPKLTELVTAMTPIVTALLNRPPAPTNNNNAEIFKALVESTRTQNELMMKSLQLIVDGIKSSSETQMRAIQESNTRFQESLSAMLEDKHRSREMTASSVTDLIMQGITLAQGLQRGEEPLALTIIREVRTAVSETLPKILEARRQELEAAAEQGPDAVAATQQQIEEQVRREVTGQMAELRQKLLSAPRTRPARPTETTPAPQPTRPVETFQSVQPAEAIPATPAPQSIRPAETTSTTSAPQFTRPVEVVLTTLESEAKMTPLPTEPKWIEEALDLFPERLLRMMAEAANIEQALAALRQFASASLVESAISAATATPERSEWFANCMQVLFTALMSEEEEEKAVARPLEEKEK